MSKENSAQLSDVIGVLNTLCPPGLAEDWDNVGLQVGDPTAEIQRLLVCLDAEEIAVAEAERLGAQLIISHHPLLYRSLKRLAPTDETGRVVFRTIRNGIAVVSAHTNLDRAADGLNDWLAERLGLVETQPLERSKSGNFYKLVVFVPIGHEVELMEALFSAGAGQIGDYDRCSFRTGGTGSFRGNDGSTPFIGRPGQFEETEELRLETIVPADRLSKVLARMLKVHPYEEVAYDLIPLANQRTDVGLGRIGRLTNPVALETFATQVREHLQVPAVRLVGDQQRTIAKVAVCGGSRASLLNEAIRMGADCLVTGDVKYHDAQRARSEGIALLDAGHFGTEQIMVVELARRLKQIFAERRWQIEVFEMTVEQDPFVTVC